MGRLVYICIGSLDGYVADERGEFDWCAPDAQVHTYLNERDQPVVAELYGRRLYEVLKVWQTYGTEPDAHPAERAYGEQWRGRDKVVFSTSLAAVETPRTQLERSFDPVAARRFVDSVDGIVTIGGPTLAAHALRAGIVDSVEYYANPVVVGGGTAWLPSDLRVGLQLTGEHRFDSGVVHLAYDVVGRAGMTRAAVAR
ncbi:dihydrofolate reductase family protein [Calidifontibacter terrae]